MDLKLTGYLWQTEIVSVILRGGMMKVFRLSAWEIGQKSARLFHCEPLAGAVMPSNDWLVPQQTVGYAY